MTKYENSKGSIFCSSNQIIENPRARSAELCPAHSVSPCPVARANSRLAAAIVVVLVVSSSSSSSSSPRSSHGPRRCCECRRKAKLGHPLSSFGCSPFAFGRLERRGERGREERRGGRANRLTAAAVATAGNLVPISAAAVVGASIAATTSTVL